MPEELRKKLIKYILRKFQNLHDVGQEAEDIVNQAFVKFYSGRKKDGNDLNFGYLSKIAFNLAKDCFNRQKTKVSLNDVEPFLADYDENLLNLEKEALAKPQLSMAINRLSNSECQIIRLRYYDEHTFQEISEITGTKINTILSHHRRGIENLRNHFSLLEKEIKITNSIEKKSAIRQHRNFQLLDD